MKYLTCVFLLALPATAAAEGPPRFRDAATHEQLLHRLGKVAQGDPMNRLPVATGEDPSVKNPPEDLISQSDIICFNGLATLVPKRAIIGSPDALKERVVMAAGARLVGWSEFLSANRAWVTTEEVSMAQAAGREPLPDATIQRIGKSGQLIVATYLGGPISVMPQTNAPTPPTTEIETP